MPVIGIGGNIPKFEKESNCELSEYEWVCVCVRDQKILQIMLCLFPIEFPVLIFKKKIKMSGHV